MKAKEENTLNEGGSGAGWAPSSTIRGIQWLVVVIMAIATVWVAASLIAAFTLDSIASPMSLTVEPDDISNEAFPAGASIDYAEADVSVDVGLGLRLLWWFVTDALALPVIAGLELLRRILRESDPFSTANATRLQQISVVAFVFAGVTVLRPLVQMFVQDSAGFDGFEGSWDFTPLMVAVGLGALVEVWRHGVALRVDSELAV